MILRVHGTEGGQTGPIWIEGTEPGDALAVKIEEIRPNIGQCATDVHPEN